MSLSSDTHLAPYHEGVRVLLVEDEEKLAALVARGLTENGDVVNVVGTGAAAVTSAHGREYDVILLDIGLPDYDGFEVCRRLRMKRLWTPVLMLTARATVADRIAGLDSGADDYLAKPFAFQELLALMRALARRGPVPRPTDLEAWDLRLDPGPVPPATSARRTHLRRASVDPVNPVP